MDMFGRKAQTEMAAKITAENAAEHARTLKETQQQVADIQENGDVGQRYLALLEVKERIQGLITATEQKVEKQAQQLKDLVASRKETVGYNIRMGGLTTILGSMGTTIFLGATTATSVFVMPVAAVLFLGSMSISDRINASDSSAREKDTKNFTTEKDDFCRSLKTMSENVLQQIKSLEDDMPTLLASRDIKTLCEKSSKIKQAFLDAALEDGVARGPIRITKSLPRGVAQP